MVNALFDKGRRKELRDAVRRGDANLFQKKGPEEEPQNPSKGMEDDANAAVLVPPILTMSHSNPRKPIPPVKIPIKASPIPEPTEKRRTFSGYGVASFAHMGQRCKFRGNWTLVYLGQAGMTSCNFLLIENDEQNVTLEQNVPQTFHFQVNGKPISVTLTYADAPKTAAANEFKVVYVEVEGEAPAGILEKFRSIFSRFGRSGSS